MAFILLNELFRHSVEDTFRNIELINHSADEFCLELEDLFHHTEDLFLNTEGFCRSRSISSVFR